MPLIQHCLEAGQDKKKRNQECSLTCKSAQRILSPTRNPAIAPIAHEHPREEQSKCNRRGAHQLPAGVVGKELPPEPRIPASPCSDAQPWLRLGRLPLAGRHCGTGLVSSTRRRCHEDLPILSTSRSEGLVGNHPNQCTYTLSEDYSMTFCHPEAVRTGGI